MNLCFPPHDFPPVMRILMPNPIGSGDHPGPQTRKNKKNPAKNLKTSSNFSLVKFCNLYTPPYKLAPVMKILMANPIFGPGFLIPDLRIRF